MTYLHSPQADADCAAQADFDRIVGAVAARFYDKTFGGLDWPARVAYYRGQVRCASTEQEVAAVANGLLAELHASHTAVFTKSDLDYWGFNSVYSANDTDYAFWFSGIWARQQGPKWYAAYVLEGSPAVAAGVVAGDELILLNGAAFSPAAFGAGANSLVISSDGKVRRTLSLTPRLENVMQAFIAAADASTRINRMGDRRIGYFHLWGARAPLLKLLQSAMRRFESERVDAVVLDLRGGYGGTSGDYLQPLRQSAYLMSIPRFFLIDDSVRSGKELLAATAARDHLAVLVGSRTAGAFLGGVPARIDGDRYFVVIAAFGGSIPDLPPIEGHGVAPTIEVDPCHTYCGGRDPLWERVAQQIAARSSVGTPAEPANARCSFDRESMLALDLSSFDQALPNGGWRSLDTRECWGEAADLIRDYREAHNLDLMILHWHEGQMRAMDGESEQAIEQFRQARTNASVPWGLYVDATIAFLQRDKPALLKARQALATLPAPAGSQQGHSHPAGWPPNLIIVDALVRCFDRSYAQAYRSCIVVPD